MKKSALSAVTAALVIGAASTSFAAANPFSDVPAGHWAYDSVTKLANEGVIEGYGDGTYRGNRNITRYEMAQMIARALAKTPRANMSSSSRAELDKLAAEFRDELDNLGVRVDELEKHSDFVKWTGEVRYRYNYDKRNVEGGNDVRNIRSRLEVRLFPTATINDHWKAKARFTATENFREDSTGDVTLTYIYAEGKYDNLTVNLGRMPLFSTADAGLVVDDNFSGLQVIYGDKLKFQLEGGRWNGYPLGGNPADYLGAELLYNDGNRFNAGAAYRHFKSSKADTDSKANIISAGLGYKFGDVKLGGYYAHNSKANNHKNAYVIDLNYAGANRNKPGSWGLLAAYRYIGSQVGLMPTYDVWYGTSNKKGFEIGATYTPMKNTWAKISYFHGKTLDTKQTDKEFFARISYYF